MSDSGLWEQVLLEFQECLEAKHQIWIKIRDFNPGFTAVSEETWQREEDRHWVHCRDADIKSTPACQPISEDAEAIEETPARELYDRWQDTLSARESDYTEYFQEDGAFPQYVLSPPLKGESLVNYLNRLAALTSAAEPPGQVKERGLRSFLTFVREAYPFSKVAFIEHIFPAEMEIREVLEPCLGPRSEMEYIKRSVILRRIRPCGDPIPLMWAAQILRGLTRRCFSGRPDSRRTSAEALGLCWVCLTAARRKLSVQVRELLSLSSSCLHGSDSGTSLAITIPTSEGDRTVPISQTLWSFLDALQTQGKLFDRTEKSLYRELARTVKALPTGLIQGRVGFQTFLILPHEFGNHRYQSRSRRPKRRKKCQSLCKS